jgi:acyl-CoA synthetase (AMP-forming)/AMP-acid ligase II
MLENTEGAIKNVKFRETGNNWCTRQRQAKQNTAQYVLDLFVFNKQIIYKLKSKPD